MRKYSGVLLMGLGGMIIAIFLLVSFKVINNEWNKLKNESEGYIFGFLLSEAFIFITAVFIAYRLMKLGRKMLRS